MKTEAYADYLDRAAKRREAGAADVRDGSRQAYAGRAGGRVIDLDLAGKGNYVRRRSQLVEAIWFVIEALIINNKLMPFSGLRAGLLRLFGARIGRHCRLVHPIRVKSPWNLEVGDSCWFGVDVWIYNQAPIRIGSNVCISQGSFLTAGSHEVDGSMDLQVAPIVIEDGVWITARCVVQKGITIGRSAVVTPLSVVHCSLEPEGIYGGNPCRFIRKRFSTPGEPGTHGER
ncbi:DapH/DapD/GlmU-related protein [Cupriavidus sp. 2TAF22]|uniref:DapH/DapD/GlmU-related protein n=1 Tax=unclassified Cupriavidus TaxID=2640874 RepID=UPI003F8E4AAC